MNSTLVDSCEPEDILDYSARMRPLQRRSTKNPIATLMQHKRTGSIMANNTQI